MPLQRKFEDGVVLSPEEVELLTKVFVATSVEGESDGERENRASRIIANYQLGISNEKELVDLSTISIASRLQ